ILPTPFAEGPDSFGQIVPGPPRPGNRFCIMGGVHTRLGGLHAGLGTADLVHYTPGLVVSFDYWPSEKDQIYLALRKRGQKEVYEMELHPPQAGVWQHADIRLAESSQWMDNPPPLEAGDAIDSVGIIGGVTGGSFYYIDNVRIWDSTP